MPAREDLTIDRLTAKAMVRGVPRHLIDGLVEYIVHGRPTGGYLQALLCGELFEAFRRGDDESLRGLKNTVMFLYNDTPAGCFGNKDNVKNWHQMRGFKGLLEKNNA